MQAKKILFVTIPSPQTELFIEYLRTQLHCDAAACNRTATAPFQPDLILVDSAQCDTSQMKHWNNIGNAAAFNIEDEDMALSLLINIPFNGIFYRNDNLNSISKGVEKMLENELWLTRNIMKTLIHYYRKQQKVAFQPAMGLTQRELEILALIASSQSNSDIADRLMLSQHTVKSHLYNIFRKISVHNRHQAIEWAHQHLNLYIPHASHPPEP
jgi:LuxR family transcriptional regulator of csgAB operon